MNASHQVFFDLLEHELKRVILPAAGNDVARRIAALAAEQLRRVQVDARVLPTLRAAALADYRALLPRTEARFGARPAFAAALDAAPQDWDALEAALAELMSLLLAQDDAESRRLAAQFMQIDARLRSAKEAACAEPAKAQADSAGQQAEPGGLDAAQVQRLEAFLHQRFPTEAALRISAVKPLTGGFSKQTLFIELADVRELPAQLVMRRDAAHFTTGGSVATEYPIIERMHAAGVRVPRPYAVEPTGEVLGTPFILVARVIGRNLGTFPVVAEPSRTVALNLARRLADMHAVPLAGLEALLYGGTLSVRDCVLGMIEQHEAMWHGVVNHRAHAVQAALDWLKRNIDLADGPRCVVHRDVGVHNFLVHADDIAAFLDWETAIVGTAAEDVAYTYYQVAQMADWDDYLAAYREASGASLDRRQLDFYMLWGSVRVAIGIGKMVDPVFSGERISLPDYYLGDYFSQLLMQRIAAKLAEVLAR